MVIFKSFKYKFLVFLAVCFCVMFSTYMRTYLSVPGEITLLEGQEYEYNIESPFFVSIQADKTDVVKLNNDSIKNDGSLYRLSSPLSLIPLKDGTVSLTMKVFGLIPLRTTKVDVVPNKKIVACGKTVGVKLKINGILVIGMSEVETADGRRMLPVKQSGIRIGDVITGVNDIKTNTIDELIKEVEASKGNEIKINYKRGDNYASAYVKPVKSSDDDKYRIGLWVRESTAGIGTLTFFDPETKRFGALGHGITDVDTGALMPIESGEIMESRILEIRKGKEGSPGELRGVFVEENNGLGIIDQNSPYGIYGRISGSAVERMGYQQYPIALRNQIKEGRASILANINGDEVKEYKIEIVRIYKQNYDSSKGMVIKITDKRLLDKTGGIVQGMSGSPIIQNGKIVGAVTHVLVNDPARGYGIFIEKMIKTMNEAETPALKKAG